MRIVHILITAFVLGFSFVSKGQQQKAKKQSFQISVDIGADQSLGPDKSFYKQARINSNTTINYYSQKRYVNPSLRFRLNMKATFTPKVEIGLQSGITWHSRENYYGAAFNYFTLPIQFTIAPELFDFGSNKLFFDAAAGVNVFRIYEEQLKEQTGGLYSCGLLLNVKKKFVYKLGYEYQIDNGAIYIPNNPSLGQAAEVVWYKQKRNQLYVAFGVLLNR